LLKRLTPDAGADGHEGPEGAASLEHDGTDLEQIQLNIFTIVKLK
jgi:hypothetical protein